MNTQYVITADIFGNKYFLKVPDNDVLNQLISYEGLLDNATVFKEGAAAERKLLTVHLEHELAIEEIVDGKCIPVPREPLSNRLKRLRDSLAMSQGEAAQRLSINTALYQHYERGRTYPTNELLICMSRLFGVTIEELVKGRCFVTNAK
jgi:DNA-binding XRE family transcriptional regulator